MSCSVRYAQAVDFVSFWCYSHVLRGVATGAAGQVALNDSLQDFVSMGVTVGDFLRNETDGSTGPITLVTPTSITAFPLTGGTQNLWDPGDRYSVVFSPYHEVLTIEVFLDIAAADVHIARKTSGQCDCDLDAAGAAYLAKLNIIEAAVIHNCPCGSVQARWSDVMKKAWLDWVTSQMKMIQEGELELCSGHTGKAYPVMDYIEMNYNASSAAEIIWRRRLRGG